MARKINGQQLGAYDRTIRIDGQDYSFAQALQLAFDDLAAREETSSSSGIIIPQLDFHASAFSDGLEVFTFWRPQSFDFLQYNPEVWLYRYKRSRKKPIGDDYAIKRKKFVHPVHLWGEKYEGSNLYAGRPDITNRYLNELDPKGNPLLDPPRRESEWDCPTAPFEKLLLDTDWNNWFRGAKPAGQGTPHGYNAAEKEIFRFGIVIDNPNEENNTRYPKLHGPMSNSELVITRNVDTLRWFINDVPYSRRGVGNP
jgi:hypothetical protein